MGLMLFTSFYGIFRHIHEKVKKEQVFISKTHLDETTNLSKNTSKNPETLSTSILSNDNSKSSDFSEKHSGQSLDDQNGVGEIDSDPVTPRSSFEIALEEIEKDNKNPAVWAEAFAHTETEDAAKRYYVRERAKILDKENGVEQVNDDLTPVREETKEKQVRRLGIFGWLCVLFGLGGTTLMEIGSFALVVETAFGQYNASMAVLWGLAILFVRIILLVVTFKLVTGFTFGYFPEHKILRPRSFFAIWLGFSISSLIAVVVNLAFHFYDPLTVPMALIIDSIIVSITFFVISFAVGLIFSWLYVLKVKALG